MDKKLRIAAFGFRSFPPTAGSAGADKFALELFPRLAALGHEVTVYNRVFRGHPPQPEFSHRNLTVRAFRTVKTPGFETLLHSAKVTWDIIRHNRADVIHIQNGGNSIFAAVLRLFGKKTFMSQDGADWHRDKWPWYGKVFLYLSSFLTSRVHTAVIFDNVFTRKEFENRFRRKYDFIPFGADVEVDPAQNVVLDELGVKSGEYFLFVGRFIPDKGLHWLVPAFERLKTDKKLILIGGSLDESSYEMQIKRTKDQRIIFPGYLYGCKVRALMSNAYAYIQPSAIEGLSPVILEAAFLGAPLICSDIPHNQYALRENGIYFKSEDAEDLHRALKEALDDPERLKEASALARADIAARFSWDSVTEQHVEIFLRDCSRGAAGETDRDRWSCGG